MPEVSKSARAATASFLAIVGLIIGATGCINGQVPEPPILAATGQPDPQLLTGRDVWAKHCVRCHGADGSGGRGPSLAEGRIAEKYPNPQVQASIITQGLNGKMPGFRTLLTADELEAVVQYTREVL